MYKSKFYCVDCKKELDRPNIKRCRKCYIQWSKILGNSSNFKNRTIEMRCSHCNKKIMKKLSQIEQNNNHVFCNFICMGLYRKNDYKGNNNPAWIDGSSYENYPQEWTESLRESIRKRDNYECQNCNMTEEEHIIVYGQVLHVHHIDYNKENCSKNNLITLCHQCNLKANLDRNYWQKFYINKIKVLIK